MLAKNQLFTCFSTNPKLNVRLRDHTRRIIWTPATYDYQLPLATKQQLCQYFKSNQGNQDSSKNQKNINQG